MANRHENPRDVDTSLLPWGAILGFVFGGILTLFFAPQPKLKPQQSLSRLTQHAREKIETVAPADPVENSLEMGKAAAKGRREELGLEVSQDLSMP